MPRDRPVGRRLQPDRDRHRLLVLEQQRRQGAAGPQLVAAGHAADRVDGVAELAQPVDVAAQGARADLEPVGQLRAGPVAVGLQQREQPQHPGAGVHVGQSISHCGQEVTYMAERLFSMTTPVIRTSGLTRHFTRHKNTVEAVRGLDLEVAQGELVAFLGPNGAGKSTTLRMLTTLLPPTSGTAEVAGYDVVREHRDVRRSIGYVGQGNAAGHAQRGRDELVSQARAFGMSRRQANERADELIAAFDLTEQATRPVSTLSGGQRRRLDVAIGLVHTPRILFLDEPSTGPRPAEPGQPPGADHPAARRAGHHDRADHALPRGGGHDRRPGGRHRPRRGHRRRLGGPAQVVARRPGPARLRLGRGRHHRRRARRRRSRAPSSTWRAPRSRCGSRTAATWPRAW